jgi:hypothetical protein
MLICTTIFWYYSYKGAVLNEIDLVDDVFSTKRKPSHFGSLVGAKIIPVVGYALVITFAILVLTVTKIQIYCVVALALHIIDLIGSLLVLQNLARLMEKFDVVAEDSEAPFVRQRREIIREYYFDNPTLPRIGILIIFTGVSLVLSVNLGQSLPYKLEYAPYALMIANILGGELAIKRWRIKRDRQLDAVARIEEAAQLRDGGTITLPA